MKNKTDITYIPYQQPGEPARRAAFIPVEFDLDNLSDEQLQVAGHLIEAVHAINPVFRDQFEPRTEKIETLVHLLLEQAAEEEKELLNNYMQILNLQNSPYSLLPRKNHLLQIPLERLQELARQSGTEALQLLEEVSAFFHEDIPTPDFANFYPQDFTGEEFKELGEQGSIVNSCVVRGEDGKAEVVLNEDIYRKTLSRAVEHLRAAREHSSDEGFIKYLDAKIREMETGSEKARREADAAWIRHDSPIDIVISSALEVYLDAYKNIRGAATGGVYLRNEAAQSLLEAIVERVDRFELEAPWTWKKESIDPDNLPELKFVDVLAWSGDYVTSPNTTLAQSLPNDRWVIENVGTVNMVFNNTTRAISRVTGQLMAEEFLPAGEAERVRAELFDGSQLHSALHEIGHTTGRMDPDHSTGQPSDYLEEEYSWLEEARAELFGIWAMPLLVEDRVISQETAEASCAGFLMTMLGALRFEPVQAHTMARNLIFHAYEQEGALSVSTETGKERFMLDPQKIYPVTSDLLKMVADIKAAGDKDAAVRLRERWMYTDPRRKELDERTSMLPLGRGLIFPQMEKDGDRYTARLRYPGSFSKQPLFQKKLA